MSELAQPSSPVLDIAPILDHGEWTSYQKRILFLVALVMVFDGVDAQVLSLSLSSISAEWGISRAAFAPVLGFSFVAMALGTALGGLLGDRVGRKWTLIASSVTFGLMTLLGALADDIVFLGVCRVIASLGMGAAMPNVTAMLAEYTPLRRRSLALAIGMSALPFGGIVVGLLGAQILPALGWRSFFVIAGCAPLIVALTLIIGVPESLRFLVARGIKPAACLNIIRHLGHAVSLTTTLEDSGEAAAVKKASVRTLMASEYAGDTRVLAVAFFTVILSSYLMFTWSPSLFVEAGYSVSMSSASMALFSLGGLIGGVGGGWLFSRFGSRKTMLCMAAGALACCAALMVTPLEPAANSLPIITVSLLLLGLCVPGTQAILFVLAAQIFPTSMRASGVGLPAAFGRLGAVLSAFIGPWILASTGTRFFGFIAAMMLILFVALTLVRRHIARTANQDRSDARLNEVR